jgi:hypothetical protein
VVNHQIFVVAVYAASSACRIKISVLSPIEMSSAKDSSWYHLHRGQVIHNSRLDMNGIDDK